MAEPLITTPLILVYPDVSAYMKSEASAFKDAASDNETVKPILTDPS